MSSKICTLVRLDWHGPFSWTKSTSGDTGTIEEAGREILKLTSCVYQLYARHKTHGENTLLYIGVTGLSETTTRNAETRINEHWEWAKYEDPKTLCVRIGVPRTSKEQNVVKLDVRRIEALLIWHHSPPYNVLQKAYNKIGSENDILLIQNWGARGKLEVECSSAWDDRKIPPEEDDSVSATGSDAPACTKS